MTIKKLFLGLGLTVAALAAGADSDLGARPQPGDLPDTDLIRDPLFGPSPGLVSPGQPFVVLLEGEFPDSCLLGPGRVETVFEDGPDPALLISFHSEPTPATCRPEVTHGEEVFGAFRVPEDVFERVPAEAIRTGIGGEAIDLPLLFFVDGAFVAAFELSVNREVAAEDRPSPFLAPGLYWEPHLRGYAFAIENIVFPESGEPGLFITAMDYRENGAAGWQIAQGPLVGNTLEATFKTVTGGDCLLCGEAFTPPWEFDREGKVPDTAEATTPMQLVVRGEGTAFLSLGEAPQRALRLVRYTQPPPPRHLSPFLPPLAGEWVFVDRIREKILPAVRFTEHVRETVTEGLQGQLISPLVGPGSPAPAERVLSADGRVEILCAALFCEIRLEDTFYGFPRANITPDRLRGWRPSPFFPPEEPLESEEFFGVRVKSEGRPEK